MSKAKPLNGKDFMIFVAGKATALATSHKLTLTAETGDAASKDDGMWDESIVTKMGWEASTEALVSADADVESFDSLYDAFIAGEKYYKGKALITSLDRTDAKGSNSTMTAQFKGQGKLEKATGAGA